MCERCFFPRAHNLDPHISDEQHESSYRFYILQLDYNGNATCAYIYVLLNISYTDCFKISIHAFFFL